MVEGLALIGTQAEVQRRAAPDQLQGALDELRQRAERPQGCPELVLVVGENGLDLAPRLGLPADLLFKSGNWIGPLLAAAAEQGVQRLLLFGYHGKLLKLAGGIFHTHHHLADGRAEVLTALAALEGSRASCSVSCTAAPPQKPRCSCCGSGNLSWSSGCGSASRRPSKSAQRPVFRPPPV